MIPLVRRWAIDWLASHDPSVCPEILSPDYTLVIGSVTLKGLDDYVAGTVGQLKNYPGLGLTVHEIIVNGNHAAVRFTEHGAAANRDGALAAWTGITLFESDGDLVTGSWAEEDYLSRQRQVKTGIPDPIEAPAIAPWDTVPGETNPGAEAAVRRWLAGDVSADASLRFNEAWSSPKDTTVIAPIEPDLVFSSGDRVAFHGRTLVDGDYRMGVSGLVTVSPDGLVSGRLVTDRAGAASALKRKKESINF